MKNFIPKLIDMARLIRINPKSSSELCFIRTLKQHIVFHLGNKITHYFKESKLKYITVHKRKIEVIERTGDKR